MSGKVLIVLCVLAFFGIWETKGLSLALSYVGLALGLSGAAVFATFAFRIWLDSQ